MKPPILDRVPNNFSEDFIEDAYQYYLKKKEGKQDD